MRRIAQDILRTNQNYIQVEYNSSNKTERKEINTEQRRNWFNYLYNRKDTIQCYKFISKDIGYINMKTITKEDIPIIKQKFKYTKGIIIDIRNYPPDIFNMLAPYFVSGTTPFSKATQGNPDNPGEFTFSSAYKIPESKESYNGKLVVIVNEETVSNAEYTAMAFRAGKHTTIVGS
jgi:C-terminal processing protease CtpA/Prc